MKREAMPSWLGLLRRAEATGRSQIFPITFGVVAIAAFQGGLGLYAEALNELFYARFGPFFDSMAYLNGLVNQQAIARTSGGIAAFSEQSLGSTVVYPWLLFAPFAETAKLTRSIGIWIQIVAVSIMHFMLFFYFHKVREIPATLAFAYSAVFCLISAVFYYNGGLSDFRMDLLQYVMMSTVMATYLIARVSNVNHWWIILGLLTALLCLSRATSPVYLIPIFGLFAVVDLYSDKGNWLVIITRWMIVVVIVAIVAGWYFVWNFDRLHYYYFIWNTDANARLPLLESLEHLKFVGEHIGVFLLSALAIIAVITAVMARRQKGGDGPRRVNWRPLVFSIVPIGFLVLNGSGLNPFVSIVGSGGIIMFLLDPISGVRPRFSTALALGVTALLALASWDNASRAIPNHSRQEAVWSSIPRQEGLRAIVGLTTEIARRNDLNRPYTHGVLHSGALSYSTLMNTLVYDHGFEPLTKWIVAHDGVRFEQVRLGATATKVEWEQQHGQTDDEKIALLVSQFAKYVDLLMVPTEDTELLDDVFISRFVPRIRAALLSSGNWEPIEGPVRISPIESILILRNRSRLPAPL